MPFNKVTGNVSLTDEQIRELEAQLNTYHGEAMGYHESILSSDAMDGWDYYYGKLPKPLREGSSGYVHPVVWNAVNGTQSEVSASLTSGETVVKFEPMHFGDVEGAEAATLVVNNILLHKNPGYRVLNDTFKESFIARNSFVKKYWDKCESITYETFEDLTKEQLDKYLAGLDGEIQDFESEVKAPVEQNDVEVYSGKVKLKKVKEGVKVEHVSFEEMLIEPTARSMCDANYIAQRVLKTKQQLLDMGFDPETVKTLTANHNELNQEVVTTARLNNLNPLGMNEGIYTGDELADKIWLHENYIRTGITGNLELLQVFTIYGQVLEINRVNKQPFTTFTPFPTPASVWGESVYGVVKADQDLVSTVIRGIIDNTNNANHRGWFAVKGQYDKNSLQNARPGRIVEQEGSLDKITPMPFHQLPQGVELLLNYSDQSREERTGVSKTAQGLNPDVFKNDNAYATVNMVMTQAMNRLRDITRNIANNSMKELMMDIYDLVRTNGKEPILIETAQGLKSIDPRSLPPRDNIIVDVAISPMERSQRSQALTAFLQMMTSVPSLAPLVQKGNAYQFAVNTGRALGITDISNYITPLDQIPEPQPDPLQQAQVAAAQAQTELAKTQAQSILKKAQLDEQELEFKQQHAADEQERLRQDSQSRAEAAADLADLEQQRVILEGKRLDVELAKLQLKKQEMMIEAQMEMEQKRAVSLGQS